MIGTHLPQCTATGHPSISYQCVNQRMLKGVPHVEGASDVWRRYGDSEWITVSRRREVSCLLPLLVPGLFNVMWLVFVGHCAVG